jgi:hypothetical protein
MVEVTFQNKQGSLEKMFHAQRLQKIHERSLESRSGLDIELMQRVELRALAPDTSDEQSDFLIEDDGLANSNRVTFPFSGANSATFDSSLQGRVDETIFLAGLTHSTALTRPTKYRTYVDDEMGQTTYEYGADHSPVDMIRALGERVLLRDAENASEMLRAKILHNRAAAIVAAEDASQVRIEQHGEDQRYYERLRELKDANTDYITYTDGFHILIMVNAELEANVALASVANVAEARREVDENHTSTVTPITSARSYRVRSDDDIPGVIAGS